MSDDAIHLEDTGEDPAILLFNAAVRLQAAHIRATAPDGYERLADGSIHRYVESDHILRLALEDLRELVEVMPDPLRKEMVAAWELSSFSKHRPG